MEEEKEYPDMSIEWLYGMITNWFEDVCSKESIIINYGQRHCDIVQAVMENWALTEFKAYMDSQLSQGETDPHIIITDFYYDMLNRYNKTPIDSPFKQLYYEGMNLTYGIYESWDLVLQERDWL